MMVGSMIWWRWWSIAMSSSYLQCYHHNSCMPASERAMKTTTVAHQRSYCVAPTCRVL
jgi:hypothetical protein